MATINDIGDVQVKTDAGWMISVRFKPWSDVVQVWIANRHDLKTDIYHFNENGQMVASELREGANDPEPTMVINQLIWRGIKQAFQGIEETPDKVAVDSELKATKYHLEDLRKLVFKEGDNK